VAEAVSSFPLTAEELLLLPDDEWRYELVAASLVREPPVGAEHGGIAGTVIGHLFAFVHGNGLGRVCVETGFVLARAPDTVRAPDVAVVSHARAEETLRDGPYFEGAPDLAIEILSPSNTEQEMTRKVGEYLGAGGRAVWVIDPRRGCVTVHLADRAACRLSRGDVLDGAPVLPGFRLAVREIFE